jgi:signal transduction histidine kinase
MAGSRFDRHRLTLGAIVVLVALLLALGVTMLSFSRSEQHWLRTLTWDKAIEGAELQVEGIHQQQAAQASYAATFDPEYRIAFERGVREASAGSVAVAAIGDASISAITRRAQAADLRHDQVVRTELYPAGAAHNRLATTAALRDANRLVEVGLRSARQIAGRVRGLAAEDVMAAKAQANQAAIVGYLSFGLALVIALAATFLLGKAQRTRRASLYEREQLLELTRTQNSDLRRLDREKDAFIASVSHELRTPLTSIRGYTEMLGDEATNLTEQQQHFLEVVDRNAERLLRLVNDLLLAAQIDDAGELEIERNDVDLQALAIQGVESASPAASLKNIELLLVTDHPVIVEGDQVRLAQVIDNLLSNAVKFTPSGGRVSLRLATTAETGRLEVTDTGMGLSADELARLFERFFRAEGATQAAIPGSGLGLAIAQAIAQAHGGSIDARNVPDGGAEFAIHLPAAT